MTTLLLSVGAGKEIPDSLAETLLDINPDTVILFVSDTSRNNIGDLLTRLRDKGATDWADYVENERYAVITITDEEANDISLCYPACIHQMRYLAQTLGIDWEQAVIDFTGGTKVMSAAIVRAAEYFHSDCVIYKGGKRSGPAMFVDPGSAVSIPRSLYYMFIEEARREIKQYFNTYQFAACLSAIDHWRRSIGDDQELIAFIPVVKAYESWDRFDHIAAFDYFNQAQRYETDWNTQPETVHINVEAVNELFAMYHTTDGYLRRGHERQKDYLQTAPITILADVYCNAERRYLEGKYDDAVARLYRLTELISQWMIREGYGEHHNAINPSFFRDHNISLDNAEFKVKDTRGFYGITSRDSYRLFRTIGKGELAKATDVDQIASILAEAYFKKIEGDTTEMLLDKRNLSILAHGFAQIEKDTYIKLRDRVQILCRVVDERFDENIKRCTFAHNA